MNFNMIGGQMPLKEYKSGTTFPGVIGRTFDKSEPAGRNHCAPKRGLQMYFSLCWTTQALDNLGVMAALSRHQTWTAWLREASFTVICIRLRFALLAVHAY